MMTAQFTSLLLRCGTLGARFVLMIALARFFDPADLGLYGLLTATIGYAIYVVGFDFYTFSNREIIRAAPAERERMARSHLAAGLGAYVACCVIALPLVALTSFPLSLTAWCALLLLTEYVAQELNRLLIALQRPVLASAALFLRSGAWAVVIVVVMWFEPEGRTLEPVLLAWTLGTTVAILLCLWALARQGLRDWFSRPDWGWVRRGLRIALPFWMASLAIRMLFTADRYWFEWLNGLELLGAYVFFGGIAATLMSFLEAAVFTFQYPRLVSAHAAGDREAFEAGVRKSLRATILVCAVFVAGCILAMPHLVSLTGKQVFADALPVFAWLVAVMVVYGFAMIPHYALYAAGHDRQILHAHVGSLVAFLATTPLWAAIGDPLLAVPRGLLSGFAAMLLINLCYHARMAGHAWQADACSVKPES